MTRCTECGCLLIQEVSIHDLLCADCDAGAEYSHEEVLNPEVWSNRPYPTDPARIDYWMDLWQSWGKA